MSTNAVTRATVAALACVAVLLASGGGQAAAAPPRVEKEILNVRDETAHLNTA